MLPGRIEIFIDLLADGKPSGLNGVRVYRPSLADDAWVRAHAHRPFPARLVDAWGVASIEITVSVGVVIS